jgi:hypothetical protein
METSSQHPRFAVDEAVAILGEQRRQLNEGLGAAWRATIAEIAAREADILAAALRDVPISLLKIPERWGAARAIEASARHLGIP